jgi:hypothetical protein
MPIGHTNEGRMKQVRDRIGDDIHPLAAFACLKRPR